MGDLCYLFFVFGVPALMLLLGWSAGRIVAANHEASLNKRQTAVAHVFVHDLRTLDGAVFGPHPPTLITAEVTLGVDHFRGFLGQLKSLIGGQVTSYQRVLDRARREVMTRLMEQANAMGYTAVANVRIDFMDISGMALMKRKAAMVSILASGTAYYRSR